MSPTDDLLWMLFVNQYITKGQNKYLMYLEVLETCSSLGILRTVSPLHVMTASMLD